VSAERELTELRRYFGERDRDEAGDGPLESAVIDAWATHGVEAAALLRGIEGFGAKHRLRTDRLLSLSEDAPLVAIAVGEGLPTLAPTGIATASAAVAAMPVGAERSGAAGASEDTAAGAADRVRATVWGPRGGSASPHLAAVAAFKRRGAESATVLLGVDGVLGGERRRARFASSNRGVPAITVAFGERSAIDSALRDLDPAPPLVTLASVAPSSRIARGRRHAGTPLACRVTLVTSEIAASGGRPRYLALIHALREDGAAGATALRGIWGFRGGLEPHGDRVLALRRDVPVLVEAVDTAERAERWRAIAADLIGTDDALYVEPIGRATELG
jgi:PII-like signaling protein